MSTMITGEANLRVVGLLQLRHRLHLELGPSGARFRQSTLQAIRRAGIADTRDRWTALYAVNEAIRDAGGPPDQQSLRIQQTLLAAGKRAPYPPRV